MGWDQGKYYTRSRKVNGKVIRTYVGCGLHGQLAALEDANKREQLKRDREAWEIMDQVPSLQFDLGGDLEKLIENLIGDSIFGKSDLAGKESLRRKLAQLRTDLEGQSCSAIERILIDRIVACWLQVQEADLRCAQLEGCLPNERNFQVRRQNAAHRRYISSIKALATVRKLALPTLQINVAEQQVNVAGIHH